MLTLAGGDQVVLILLPTDKLGEADMGDGPRVAVAGQWDVLLLETLLGCHDGLRSCIAVRERLILGIVLAESQYDCSG